MIQSLIVLSHLRWDFVFQRPQQLMSRLARDWHIAFFEEPVNAPACALRESSPAPNVTVYRPHTTVSSPGFHDDQIPQLQEFLEQVTGRLRPGPYGVWLYTPMALPLLKDLDPAVVVYDCMDELSAFRNAPRQVGQRESALLKQTDIVFTGGPSLYNAKRGVHPNVHCFPSSVDADHFGRPARDHPLQAGLARPRLGFFGVIDERIDLDLLAQVADARPDWNLVMVGPVSKIETSSLPRRPNILYCGQQPYASLPDFIAGWDVCLQPFAMNESTRFISPTKTLEYMAAGRPIVTTPVADVVEPYGAIVQVASDAAGFIEACERVLRENGAERARRERAMRETVTATSWERTAAAMKTLVEAAAARRATQEVVPYISAPPAAAGEGRVARRPVERQPREYPAIVLGAGPTGLSAGYHLGEGSLVLEQNERVGGWCRSVEEGGFTFDHAGHIMFSNDPYVHRLYRLLLGENVHWQDREAWIYSKRTYTRYPFQGALYGLPPDVLKECIVGAIEARFGPLRGTEARDEPGSVAGGDCCADGVLATGDTFATSAPRPRSDAPPENFERFIYRVWGKGIARHFAVPYNRKLWAVPLREMETSWLGGRVPLPDLEQMIEGALKPVPRPQGPNARFGYPLRGGFQALMDGFLPHLRGELVTGARVIGVDAERRTVTLADGRRFRYRRLVSTAPLPALVRLLGDAVPGQLRAAASRLRHVSVRCVNLGIGREGISEKHWIYYPENGVFHRIFLQGNASPHCNPPGGFGLTCEITYSPYKPLPVDGDALVDRCIADCIDVGLLRPDDPVLVRNQLDLPYAYVVYDHERAANVATLRAWLDRMDITLAGRYAEWEYYNSDHAFIAGKRAAEQVLATVGGQDSEAVTSA
jgi:UDP-galactopyranose mutase